MSWVHGLAERLRAVFRRQELERQLEEEIRFHLEMETERHVRAGLSETEARRRAEREFGRVDAAKESVRDERGVGLIEDLVRETRFALRRLRKRPSFSVTALLTLGLGIGATTAIFSVVHGVLLKPLPFPESERLVVLGHEYRPAGGELRRLGLTDGSYLVYREDSRSFDQIGGFGSASMTLAGGETPERIVGAYVTAGLLATLRVAPILGRGLGEEDDRPGAAPVALIGYGLWQRRFGGSDDIVGRTLRIDNVEHEVIGVMPASFRFPSSRTEIWRALRLDPSTARSVNYWMPGIGRLAPGVTAEAAATELDALFPRQFERFPNEFTTVEEMREGGMRPTVRPLKEVVVGDVQEVLWVLLAAVGLILAIACANVANLFLVQTEEQERELAMRRALGAGDGQLARYFLAQSLLLGLAGGALGVGLAYAGVKVLVSMAPPELPRTGEIGIDATVLAFTAGLSVLAALLFGAFPLLRLRAHPPASTLQERGRGTTTSRARGRTRNALVAAQLALALVLLSGSGLMMRTFWNLRSVDPGFDARKLLAFRLTLPKADYPEPEQMAAFHVALVDRLSALPGVTAATGVWTGLPFEHEGPANPPHAADFTPPGETPLSHPMKVVTPGYFRALGIPLVAGRALERRDYEEGTGASVVSAAFARRYWSEPNEALGRRFRMTPDGEWHTIVGVAGDTRDAGLREAAPELVYWALKGAGGEWYYWPNSMSYALRTDRAAADIVPILRRAVSELDPNLPVYAVRSMEEIVAGSLAATSFAMAMLVVGAVMALMIGAVGIYGVMSYAVTQRTREIGVRMALGAGTPAILGMVLRQALVVISVGAAFGVLGAVALTRTLRSLLFGVEPIDPLTYAAVGLLMAAVALAATYLPARRAAHVDPCRSLRFE